jgi:hypothetical protein
MRLLVYLVFGIIVLVLMGYAAPWLYRRPTVKRQQLRDVIAHRDAYKMQVIEDEKTLRNIRKHIAEVGVLDSPLAMKIELELEPHTERLDNPFVLLPERKNR